MLERRTEEELNDKLYNYYLFFKINPMLKPEDIEVVLKKEKNKWVQGTIIERRYGNLWEDIINVMINDATWNGTEYVANTGGRSLEYQNARSLVLNSIIKYLLNCIDLGKRIIFVSEIKNLTRLPEHHLFVNQRELTKGIEEQIIVKYPEVKIIDDKLNY